MMPVLGRSKGASPHFVVSSYEAAPQNEVRNHEAENNQRFYNFLPHGLQHDSEK